MNILSFKETILFLSLVILANTCFNCGDTGTTSDESSGYCIRGRITSWTPGQKTLHAYIRSSNGSSYSVSSCPVASDGSFNLCLPLKISDTSLSSSDSIFYTGCSGGNVIFDPPDVRGTELINFNIKSGDSVIGYLKCNNYETLFQGAYYLKYIWVNKRVNVTGSTICSSDTLVFNGTAVSEWNKVSVIYNRISTTAGATILYKFSEPGGAEWKYFSY